MPQHRRPRVSVRSSPSGSGLWCEDAVAADGVVAEFDGSLRAEAARFSVQVGIHEHVHPDDDAIASGDRTRFLWRFLNHSCSPNCRVDGRLLVALRDLAAGEELTFDYNATEWSLATPFPCACGACDGADVRGFAHLDGAARRLRRGSIAAHLLERLGHADA